MFSIPPEPDPNEIFLTATEVRKQYGFTPRMMMLIRPATTYRRIGQKHPVCLYRLSDVLKAKNSVEGRRLLAEAEARRARFWNGVRMRVISHNFRNHNDEHNEENDD